jgi:hypothetical protein
MDVNEHENEQGIRTSGLPPIESPFPLKEPAQEPIIRTNRFRRFYLPAAVLVPLAFWPMPWIVVFQIRGLANPGMHSRGPMLNVTCLQTQSGIQILSGSSTVQNEGHTYYPRERTLSEPDTERAILSRWPALRLAPFQNFGSSSLSWICLATLMAAFLLSLGLPPGSIRATAVGILLVIAIGSRSIETADGFPLERAVCAGNPTAEFYRTSWYSPPRHAFHTAPGTPPQYPPPFQYTNWFFYAQLALALPLLVTMAELFTPWTMASRIGMKGAKP